MGIVIILIILSLPVHSKGYFIIYLGLLEVFTTSYSVRFLDSLNLPYRWLTPVILASYEAEIRRMDVQSQPGQTVCETLSGRCPAQKRASGVAQLVECLLRQL
jgi:hypothetical protein